MSKIRRGGLRPLKANTSVSVGELAVRLAAN
jgi:hypothetical protein